MKSILKFVSSNANKILLSLLVVILSLVVFFIPESKIQTNTKSIKTQQGFNRLNGDSKGVEKFGRLNNKSSNSNNGYKYISNRKRKRRRYGRIDLSSKSNDKDFKKRVDDYFKDKGSTKYLRSKNFNYAIVDNNIIYIENIDNCSVKGFNDVVDLGIVVNTSGVLDSIRLISSNETPSYMKKIVDAGYFQEYNGLSLSNKNTIDAVAGATITTVAIAKSIDELVNLTKNDILSDYVSGISNFSISAKLSYVWIVNLILIMILFSVFMFKLVKGKRARYLIYIFSVLWLGFYLNSSFTYLLFIKSFSGIELSVFTIAYLLLVLFSSIWDKNTYCRTVCPFGNAQRLIKKVSPFKQPRLPFKNKRLKQFRYVVTVIVVVSYFAGIDKVSSYELFPHLFGLDFSSVILYLSILVVFISLWIPNLYCRAFCTTGCALDGISDLSDSKGFKFSNKKN